jgi:hypothetical protein
VYQSVVDMHLFQIVVEDLLNCRHRHYLRPVTQRRLELLPLRKLNFGENVADFRLGLSLVNLLSKERLLIYFKNRLEALFLQLSEVQRWRLVSNAALLRHFKVGLNTLSLNVGQPWGLCFFKTHLGLRLFALVSKHCWTQSWFELLLVLMLVTLKVQMTLSIHLRVDADVDTLRLVAAVPPFVVDNTLIILSYCQCRRLN